MKYCQQQKKIKIQNVLKWQRRQVYGENNVNTTNITDYPGTYSV